jgi:Flp pilus assembly pilin Flp
MLPLTLFVKIHVSVLLALEALRQRCRDERGQTTAEYALVLLGAAAVALLLVVWARSTNKVGKLLDAIIDQVIDMVE